MAELMKANKAGFVKARDILQAGGLVALPTDTVYGLAGLANSQKVRDKIYTVKNRPRSKALSVVVFQSNQAKDLVRVSPLAQSLIDAFWPGALTLVLPTISRESTLAIRCPDIDWTQAFMDIGFMEPLFLPSANISGKPAPVTAAQVQTSIGRKIPLILDGGICKSGQASTIISLIGKQAKLLRVGTIAPEQFAAFDMNLL